MDTNTQRLKELITEHSYREGEFILASGQVSDHFFDVKRTLLLPEGAALTAKMILDKLKNQNVTAIGGLELGACPVVSNVVAISHSYGKPINGFYIRKQPKGRGTNQRIEGLDLNKDDRVVLVEDVTTTGGSVLKAVEAITALGCDIAGILTIVDRQQGAEANLARHGLSLTALLTREDFKART